MNKLMLLCSLVAYSQVSFTVGNNGLTSLSHAGTSYYNATPVTILYYFCPVDYSARDEIYSPASVKTSGANWYQQVYNGGSTDSLTIKTTYSSPDANTLKAIVEITNNDPARIPCSINFNPFQFTAGSAGQFSLLQTTSTVSMKVSASESVAFWADGSPPFMHVRVFDWTGGSTSNSNMYFDNAEKAAAGTYPSTTYPGLTKWNQQVISPGQTVVYNLYMRWGGASDTIDSLVPENRNIYQTQYPNILTWGVRSPVCTWFMSSSSYKSANNPRGYLEPGLNATGDPAAFRAALFTRADTVIERCRAMTPKCQGVYIWDIEGFELPGMVYMGDPTRLDALAPEMDSVADELIRYLQDAGLKVGLLIRPQQLTYVSSPAALPATCNAFDEWQNWAVNASAGYLAANRLYKCDPTDTWVAAGSDGPYFQPGEISYDAYLNLLRTKIAAAKERWGIKMVYSDSSGFPGYRLWYQIWGTLQAEFPDMLFNPETFYSPAYSTSAPYLSTANGSYSAYASVRALDEYAFSFLNFGGEYAANSATIINGMASGDFYSNQCWYDDGLGPTISSYYGQAAVINSALAITSNGSSRVFQSDPGTSFDYPLVMRVYFADSANNLAASTTFCTKRGVVYCYLSGVLQPTATIDLSTTPYYQIRYYDFAGNLVSQGPYATLQ